MTHEQYFDKIVGFMEMDNVKQNSFLVKDTTIIQSNLDSILNVFINIADGSNTLINNKNIELEESKTKYKNMLLEKENFILIQKQELQEVHSNLLALRNEDEERNNELLNIKIEHNKQLEQLDSNLKDKHLLVEEYKGKNDDLLGSVAEYKHYKLELEEYKELLVNAQARKDRKSVV